jgi:hypothetical protein
MTQSEQELEQNLIQRNDAKRYHYYDWLLMRQ